MTRHLVMSFAILLVFAAAGFGQGFEAFGGYSYSHSPDNWQVNGLGSSGAHGFTGALTGNINPWFGLTGDLDYHTKTVTDVTSATDFTARATSFRFGPRFTSRVNDTVSTFAHVLVGGTRATVGGNGTEPVTGLTVNVSDHATGFSSVAGGGLDLRVGPRIAIRPAQIEWEHIGSMQFGSGESGSSNGMRYSAGIVIRF